MTYKQLTYILIFIPIGLFSQQFERVDSYVDNLTVNKTIEMDDLTSRLTEPFSEDIDKVRAIFYWIADNIEYDYENFKNKTITSNQVQPETI